MAALDLGAVPGRLDTMDEQVVLPAAVLLSSRLGLGLTNRFRGAEYRGKGHYEGYFLRHDFGI